MIIYCFEQLKTLGLHVFQQKSFSHGRLMLELDCLINKITVCPYDLRFKPQLKTLLQKKKKCNVHPAQGSVMKLLQGKMMNI